MDRDKITNDAYLYALRLLVHKPRTESEIKAKVGAYILKYSPDKNSTDQETIILEKIIDILKEEKFIDDSRYVKDYIDVSVSSKKRSSLMLKRFLERKGIDTKLFENETQIADHEYDLEAALIAGKKKLRSLNTSKEKDYIIKRKLYSYLMGKGYFGDTLKNAVDTLLGVK